MQKWYLQSAAKGSDPVQPIVEQGVPDSLGETASKLLFATGFGVSQGCHVGLLQCSVKLLQPIQRFRLASV